MVELKMSLWRSIQLPKRLHLRPEKSGSPSDLKSAVSAHGSFESSVPQSHAPPAAPEDEHLPTEAIAPGPEISMPASAAISPTPPNLELELPEKIEDWICRIGAKIRDQCHQFVATNIDIGLQFLAAQCKYQRTLKALALETGLKYGMVAQYVKFAEWRQSIGNSWAPAQLPDSVDSQMRLSRLEPDQFRDALATGLIRPDMKRKEVIALLRQNRPPRPNTKLRTTVSAAPVPQEETTGSKPLPRPLNQAEATEDDPACELPFDLDLRRQDLKATIMRAAEAWLPEHLEDLIASLRAIASDIRAEWRRV